MQKIVKLTVNFTFSSSFFFVWQLMSKLVRNKLAPLWLRSNIKWLILENMSENFQIINKTLVKQEQQAFQDEVNSFHLESYKFSAYQLIYINKFVYPLMFVVLVLQNKNFSPFSLLLTT